MKIVIANAIVIAIARKLILAGKALPGKGFDGRTTPGKCHGLPARH